MKTVGNTLIVVATLIGLFCGLPTVACLFFAVGDMVFK